MAGIRRLAPGYSKVQIKPTIVGGMTKAAASIDTPLGAVSSAWTKTSKAFTLKVHVPVGATADVYVPTKAGDRLFQTGGVTTATDDASTTYVKYTVVSGDYQFTSSK